MLSDIAVKKILQTPPWGLHYIKVNSNSTLIQTNGAQFISNTAIGSKNPANPYPVSTWAY